MRPSLKLCFLLYKIETLRFSAREILTNPVVPLVSDVSDLLAILNVESIHGASQIQILCCQTALARVASEGLPRHHGFDQTWDE